MATGERQRQLLDGAVRNILHEALREVWRRYTDVIRERTHEVTVIAKVAAAMQPRIDDTLGPGYRVDVEYNRRHDPAAAKFRTKYLPDRNRSSRPVRPDLIVHDGTSNPRHNLLVIEAKQGTRVKPETRKYDYDKLQGFLSVYNYRQAVYLEFDGIGGPPRLEWLQPGHPQPDPTQRPAHTIDLS